MRRKKPGQPAARAFLWPDASSIRHNSQMTWSIAALAILSVVLFALLRTRLRSASMTPGSSSLVPGDPSLDREVPDSGARETETGAVRSCPVCLGEYHPRNRFCVRDGAPLHDGRPSTAFSQGMICPTCRRGYPSDAAFCPEDADELVPYGLYGAATSTRSQRRLDGNKICPECGIRHAATHLFCGQDGAELVVVN